MKKKGGRAGKQRQLGTDETNIVEKKLRIDLADVEMIGSTSIETHWLRRNLDDKLDDQEGFVFTSEYENTA